MAVARGSRICTRPSAACRRSRTSASRLEAGDAAGADRPERRGQDDLLQHAERPDRPDRGSIRLSRARAGRPAAAPDLAARRRPHLPDHADLHQSMTVLRECADGPALSHHGPHARSLAGHARSTDTATRRWRCSSGSAWSSRRTATAAVLAYGDLKRVELAVALANEPTLLLMDEPTAGMAPRCAGRADGVDRGRSWRERGISPSCSPSTTWTWSSATPTACWSSIAGA